MTIDPSTNVPGGTQGEPPTNTPPNVGNPGLNVNQSTPTLEEYKQLLAAAEAKNAKLEDEAFQTREKARKRKEQEAADKAALEQKLKEQGEFKPLAEQLQLTVSELQAQIAQRDQEIANRDHEALRVKVAAKYGLAPELATRLNGATEEELNVDAAALKKLVGEQVQQARLPGNGPNPTPTTGEKPREQQIREFKERRSQSGAYGL